MALALGRRGWSIALHYRSSREEAETAAEELRGLGVACTLLQADLEDADQALGLVQRAVEAHPDLRLLVNSASLFEARALLETSLELWERQFALHVRAPFLLQCEFVRRVGRGSIVNVLDTRILGHRTTHAAYLLSKKTLAEMTLMAAREWAPSVRVNGLALGPFLPPVGGAGADVKRRLEAHPMGRCGTEEELESGLMALVENGYLTGQILYLDGGERL
jgi:pteridine reductase